MDEKLLERIATSLERIATALEPSEEGASLTVADNLEFIAGALRSEDDVDLADLVNELVNEIAGKKET